MTPKTPQLLIATFFGAGLLPRMPGTWGSLAALPVAWLLHAWGGPVGLFAAATAALLVGMWAVGKVLEESETADPPWIVIDEVAGQWLTLAPFSPEPLTYAVGFLLFRFFDIVKPWPVSWFDRNVKGAFGVMLDDVAAAVYAGLILYGVETWLLP